MERIAMSQQERDRLEWLKQARDKRLTQSVVAERMGVSERWVRKMIKGLATEGDAVVVHGLRDRASNRKLPETIRAQAMALLHQPEWHDFGPTYASQQLAKQGVNVSDETLRRWMIGAGIWKPNTRTSQTVHAWRARRSGFGELVQWDTSTHDWLEGRGPVRYLVRMIDDATSWSWGRFVEHDSTPFNMAVLWEYIDQNGRMVDVYTDRAAMFMVTPRAGESKTERQAADRLTQLGRGLRELGIGWIPAHSPQAKGRVERSFRTDQDRLVKDLRLAKITTLETANAFLAQEYWPHWNERFARPVKDFPNEHRALTPHLELASILCHVEERVIANDYTFSFAGRRYRIARDQVTTSMRGQHLRIELHLEGDLKARYQGRSLDLADCVSDPVEIPPEPSKPVRKDHNAGGKSGWMQGFFDRPAAPLWSLIKS